MATTGDTRAKEIELLAQKLQQTDDTVQNSVTPSEGFSEEAVTQETEGIADADTEKVENPEQDKRWQDFQSELHKTQGELKKIQAERDVAKREVEQTKAMLQMLTQQAEAGVVQKQGEIEGEFDPYNPKHLERIVSGAVDRRLREEDQRRRLEQMRQDFFSKVPDATEQDFMDTLNWSQRNLTPYDVWLVRNRGAEMAKLTEEARKRERERIAEQSEKVSKTPASVMDGGGVQGRLKKQTPEEKEEADFKKALFSIEKSEREAAGIGIDITSEPRR